MSEDVLLEVKNLSKYFPVKGGIFQRTQSTVRAVDHLDFHILRKETFGLVGESGCGKSTTGRTLLRLLEPTGGRITFEGEDLLQKSTRQMNALRRQMQLIFQDPYSSLNPRMTVRRLIAEPLYTHRVGTRAEIAERVRQMITRVGLKEEHLDRYPHQFSGGQRQRISIARALILEPKLVVADEAVSALDVSIQAQVLNLLMTLQKEMGLTMLFISHDLNVVRHVSQRIGVMYLGQMMEQAETQTLFDHPLHPYTQALLASIPVDDPLKKKPRVMLEGDVPDPSNPPSGCPFHLRCPQAFDRCRLLKPDYREVVSGHWVACHLQEMEGGGL